MSVFLGSDTVCLDDLPLIDTQTSDPLTLVGQRLARRLSTQRGALAFINDDPNGGLDVRQYVLAKMSTGQRSIIQNQVQAECLKDEEVQTASVDVSFNTGALIITIAVTTGSGPFTLTLNVDQLTVQAVFSFGNQ